MEGVGRWVGEGRHRYVSVITKALALVLGGGFREAYYIVETR